MASQDVMLLETTFSHDYHQNVWKPDDISAYMKTNLIVNSNCKARSRAYSYGKTREYKVVDAENIQSRTESTSHTRMR